MKILKKANLCSDIKKLAVAEQETNELIAIFVSSIVTAEKGSGKR